MNDASIDELREWVNQSQHMVVITGAGMSTESGIADYRSENGRWRNEALIGALSRSTLAEHPEYFWSVFRDSFMTDEFRLALPNAGHNAFAALEEKGIFIEIFTQNVDGLHQLAGSKHVYEMHGNLRQAACPMGHGLYDLWSLDEEEVPRCHYVGVKGDMCEHVLKPSVVLFEEPIYYYIEAFQAVRACDLLLVVGSSLTVEPVASLPTYLQRENQAKLVVINRTPTECDDFADLIIRKDAGKVLSQLIVD